MASIIIAGDTSGAITLASPAVAGSNTLTLPSSTDTLVGKATTDTLTNKTLTAPAISSAVMTTMASSVITSATAQNSTSGTSIDFTGIPSWVKRITVMLSGVSTNGTSAMVAQLATSGGLASSGYVGTIFNMGSTTNAFSTNFIFAIGIAAATNRNGAITFTNLTGNTWVMTAINGQNTNGGDFAGGSVTLSNTLTQVRITTANGTDTFDAGSINILYE